MVFWQFLSFNGTHKNIKKNWEHLYLGNCKNQSRSIFTIQLYENVFFIFIPAHIRNTAPWTYKGWVFVYLISDRIILAYFTLELQQVLVQNWRVSPSALSVWPDTYTRARSVINSSKFQEDLLVWWGARLELLGFTLLKTP